MRSWGTFNMHFNNILRLAIFPIVLLLLLSFVSVVLTTHYWILGRYRGPSTSDYAKPY